MSLYGSELQSEGSNRTFMELKLILMIFGILLNIYVF